MTIVDNKSTPAKAPNNKNNLFETFDFFAVDKQPQSLSTTTAGIEQKKSDFDLLNL